MHRTRMIAFAALSLILLVGFVYLPSFAHDDHAPPPTDGFDPFAPRTVSPETATLIGLAVEEVDFGVVERVERLTGVVRFEPGSTRTISPRIVGTIAAAHVQIGDRVRVGDALIEIDSPELARLRYELAQLESERVELEVALRGALGRARQAEASQRARRARLELAEQELVRLESSAEAVSVNLVAQKRAEALTLEMEAEAAAIEAELARDEAEGLALRIEATSNARQALEQVVNRLAGSGDADAANAQSQHPLTLRSPIDGIIIARTVSAGQDVQQGDRLLEIAVTARVQVIAEVSESRMDRVRSAVGKPARLRQSRQTDVRATGIVRAISPVIDSIKRTSHVIIEAENGDGSLCDGMFVEAAIVLEEGDFAVVAPHEAILKDGPERYVFVREGEQFRRQEVALGSRDDRFVEVLDGLVPGDEIVVHGAYAVSQLRQRVAASHDHGHDDHHGHAH